MTHLTFDLVGYDDEYFFIASSDLNLRARIPFADEKNFEGSCSQRSWTNDFKFCLEQSVAQSWCAGYNYPFLNYSEIKAELHFEVYPVKNQWHWAATGRFEITGLTSEEDVKTRDVGFDTEGEAIDEAKEVLSLASKYGAEAGLMRYEEFQLIACHLYPSDQESIMSAVKCMPRDIQFEHALVMARITEPMPERYWPDED